MPPLRPRNFSSRVAGVDVPHPTKGVAARIQARQKKTRSTQNSEPKEHAAAAAKKRTQKSSKIQLNVPTTPQLNAASSSQAAAPNTIPVTFPKRLPRPPYKALSPEAVKAIGLERMLDADPLLIRGMVDDLAPGLLPGLYNLTNPGFNKAKLNETILCEYNYDVKRTKIVPPTHMVAVRSRTNATTSGAIPNYTLYPVHSMVMAANCAHLPPFPAPLPADETLPENQVKVPVWPLILPSVATYGQLSHFLYTKDARVLVNAFLPKTTIPANIATDPSLLAPFAAELAETFTVQLLMKHMMYVYGLWQNTVALGIFVDSLWETIELLWKILLSAISIAKGYAREMLSEEELIGLQRRQETNAASGPSMF